VKASEPNSLIHESSPYLLQHAYNPVQWEGWHDTTLEHAQKSGKLLLISIGYAACHWCHVMERECFEDPEVADVMNAHFIPVKVDREERPDVDQIYMDALQVMSGNGGWPLNIVALPDGRPFWGATYVPKKDWVRVLMQLAKLYREDPEKVVEYASDLTSTLHRINTLAPAEEGSTLPGIAEMESWVRSWKKGFDPNFGGNLGAPKFMTPVLYQFLMHWGEARGDGEVREHVQDTLRGMAYGGLFDHVGGGFSRYSVDPRWHVPHFEKMLYDNAQLLSLYSEGFALYGEALYKEVVVQTLEFLNRELKRPEGWYYASLDADSLNPKGELEEGAFYTWEGADLTSLLREDFEWFQEYYNINDFGLWEKGRYVLIRTLSDEAFAQKRGWTPETLQHHKSRVKKLLLKVREERPRPRLDDKVITSWNGLMLGGLCDAFRYCGLEDGRQKALDTAGFMEAGLSRPDGGLLHSFKEGGKSVNGYLEDYAAVIQGYIKLYGIIQDPSWMDRARELATYCLEHFAEAGQPLLYFSSSLDRALIRRTLEVNDSVMPASNSLMAKNLFTLGAFFSQTDYTARARDMLDAVKGSLQRYPGQYSNWMHLALWMDDPFYEVVITGPEALEKMGSLQGHYLPHVLLAASKEPSSYPLFEHRHRNDSTRIFICQFGQCRQPVLSASDALKEIALGGKE
jgi:uncharacterized protein YyaL (SSP411 family)